MVSDECEKLVREVQSIEVEKAIWEDQGQGSKKGEISLNLMRGDKEVTSTSIFGIYQRDDT